MSLVGIRPVERAQFDARPQRLQDAYVSMRPGMTGLWQTSGRSTLTMEERDALDIEYAESASPWLDLKLLLKTPFVMLQTRHTA